MDELCELARRLAALAGEAAEFHLLNNTCYRDHGVRNASQRRDVLADLDGASRRVIRC